MATQRIGFAVPLDEFYGALLAERELAPRSRLIANHVAALLPEVAVLIYAIEDQAAPLWNPKAVNGDIGVEQDRGGAVQIAFEAGTLGVLGERREPLLFAASELAREDYAHLDVRQTVASIAYVPLIANGELVGAIELVSFRKPITTEKLAAVLTIADHAAVALASAIAYERERNSNLESIARLAQLYDLEKVFNSKIELEELLPLVASKFQEVLNAQAVNLWMVEDDALLLVEQSGADPTVEVGSVQKSGEGIAAAVSDSGEALLIDDADDERLQQRNPENSDSPISSLIAAPLVAQGVQVGVAEVINKNDGTAFSEDDLFLLGNICEAAAGALHNASLLNAERKVEILETLVRVSQEITSTLNLDRVLQAVVNGPGAVIPYERAAIALEQRGRLQVKAISGVTQLNPGDADVARINDLLQWASISGHEIHITQPGEQVEAEREETRAKFETYFSETGMRAFYAVALVDDQGRLGMLSFESSDAEFLSEAHVEMIKVLAGQVTVAIRNAELYKEVPFIGVLEPLLQKKRKFFAMEKQRQRAVLAAVAGAIAFLTLFPFPMRVDGDAVVAPLHTAQIQPEVEGVVKKVYVREGDQVKQGSVIADLDDWEYRAALLAAQAKYGTAKAEAARALASNDGSEAGMRRVEADFWAAELRRAQERVDRARLRSPISGVIATPRLENSVGKRLKYGDTLAEVINTATATIDVAIAEDEMPLVKPDVPGKVLLEGFPTRTFKGKVLLVSPRSQPEADRRVFLARVEVPNDDRAIRAGMQGRGKIWAGWRPAGYVLFRRPVMWIYSKLWNWFGW